MSYSYGRRSRSRPFGLTVLCVVGFLKALWSILEILGILATGSPLAFISLFFLALVVVKLFVLVGLWTLQRWAYSWAVVIYALSAAANLVGFDFFGVAVDALIVLYLMAISRHFR